MWILPTRSRPHNISRLIDAWYKTGASTPVEMCIDLDDHYREQYEEIVLPSGWSLAIGTRGPLSSLYNEVYQRYPSESWYGFIADDVVPITKVWDTKLIEIAGSDGMAVPDGGETTGGCPHFVLGGDLVRSIGWLSLPGLDRIYIDTVWGDIAKTRGVYRQVPDVTLEHHHFSNHKAMLDKTYLKSRKLQDKLTYDNWRNHANLS